MGMTRRTVLAALATAVAGASAGNPALDDLAYAETSSRNRLDVHLPEGKGPFPWLLDLHGGGFRTGDKRSLPVPPQLPAQGIAVVRMNYRLSNQALWPAQEGDVLAAVAFLNRRGPDLGLMPGRMALGGRSAGAFMAVSAALTLAARDRPPRAVVDFYGPMDFGSLDADLAKLGRRLRRTPADSPRSVESLLVGYPVGQRREQATPLSPVGRLRAMRPGTPLPPLMIRHGAQDGIVPAGQAERLRTAWAAVDPRAEIDFALLPHEGHGTGGFGRAAVQEALARFLARHLSG
ncbi:Acetyl esterase/lipase [Paracoccus aminovorans]|uniref:Acetyl esterase/lipase n=1 Tax=Paracoccus aminovorans TaxID=34004 RepID=A0A1I3EG62_9RHOB|nr:alpha/beta hydrolase [Paracoccus aminovorans]CQR86012.1 esterase/lipase [Paracoccus aminovorans]SFH97947.1 Acetyl esterase/lipase [Paracoccus aminovorans]